jgi:hypothetical protein
LARVAPDVLYKALMSSAITASHGRVAPCFSGAELLIFEAGSDLARVVPTAGWPPLAWGRELRGLGVGTLICNGIYPFLWGVLRGHGIEVIPNASGEPDDVMRDWHRGVLTAPEQWPCYPMLQGRGCRPRQRRRFRGGRG